MVFSLSLMINKQNKWRKKPMKKFFCILIVVTMIISMTACANENDKGEVDKPATPADPSAAEENAS